MIYDFIILGGGISGLYTAHKLHKKHPRKTILILEKEGYLGGRVYTFHNKYMTVDAGAGRFSKNHTLLMQLLRELKLTSKIWPITSSAVYAPSDGSGSMYNSIMDAPMLTRSGLSTDIGMEVLDIALGQSNNPSAGLLVKVILASRLESKEDLIQINFVDYAKRFLSPAELKLVIDSFGYYSELVIMNAYDAIQLMDHLGPQNQFYVLGGGLSQIIERLVHKLESKYISIYKQKTVEGIEVTDQDDFLVKVLENKRPYIGKVCICALPKQVLEKISLFRPFYPLIKQIVCAPLCRIYSKFPTVEGKSWFSGLPKFTTNNNLRMVIPVKEEEGIIMVSYTDNKFANYWKKIYEKEGVQGVNDRIAFYMKESTGINIPGAIDTQVFYWGCGVGYWGVGADSVAISGAMIRPIVDLNLFVCGEHFSAGFQQWMEGGLETSEKVLTYF
jgi:oxygen-dependent protoporphyrinogen oxidase